jgi:DNA-binding SARP family transcriptional activator
MTPDPRLQLNLLGAVDLRGAAGQPVHELGGKPMALLSYLALHPAGVPRDELVALLWPDRPDSRARASLRQTLWLLRSALPDGLIRGEELIEVDQGTISTDLDTFQDALESDDVDAALDLWKGPPFADFRIRGCPAWDDWVDQVRSQAERRLASALHRRASERLEVGDFKTARELALRATEVAPYLDGPRALLFESALKENRLPEAERIAAAWPDAESASELHARLEEARRAAVRRQVHSEADVALPFVGRTRERERLLLKWSAVRTGEPQVVLLHGDPGIGKSRLAREIATLAELDGARIVQMKGTDPEGGLPLSAFSELVRSLISMEGGAGISPASDAVLAGLLPSRARSSFLHPTSDSGMLVRLADAMKDLLGAVSDDGPLVLVLDDFGWFDESSRAVLRHALRSPLRAACLSILTCREDCVGPADRPDGFGDGSPSPEWAERIRLEPLTESEVQELVAAVLVPSPDGQPQGDPDPGSERAQEGIVSAVSAASGGSPLFALELLRTLEGRKALAPHADGGWIVKGQIEEEALKLPDHLDQVLEAALSGLSSSGARLAGHLSLAQHAIPIAELENLTGMPPDQLSAAIREIRDRHVGVLTRDGELSFSHDEMRAAAKRRFGDLATLDRRSHRVIPLGRWGLIGSAAAVAGLALAAFAYLPANGRDSPPAPRFGGGQIILTAAGTQWVIDEFPGLETPWTMEASTPPPGASTWTKGPFPSDLGEQGLWFGWEGSNQQKPWISRLSADGPVVVFRSPGDDYFQDLSPDGRSVLVTSEPRDRQGPYRLDLILQPLPEGAPVTLYRGEDLIVFGRFSPDGHRIAAVERGVRDAVIVLNRAGSLLDRIEFGRIGALSWCGNDRIAVIVDESDVDRMREIELSSGSIQSLEVAGFPASPITCSPDGDAVVYTSAIDGNLALVLQERGTGVRERLPVPPGLIHDVRWVRDGVIGIPEGLEIEVPPSLEWGSGAVASATLRSRDGSSVAATDDIEWRSSNPSVVSVDRAGVIRANGPGSSTISAIWDGWLEGDAVVQVIGEAPGNVLFENDFRQLLWEEWIQIGAPPARTVEIESESVLLLDGDALYYDGLMGRKSFALPLGGTLEAEVRIPLTRRDKQWIFLCLVESEPPASDTGIELMDLPITQRSCFRYPAGALGSMRADQATIHARSAPNRTTVVSPHFPSDDWVHVAMQMRPDGETAFFVNREGVGTAPLRAENGPGTEWRVMLLGASWETQVLVRNLRLWEGTSY